MEQQRVNQMPGRGFSEHHVEAAGYRIRYAEAGEGQPLVVLPTSAGLTHAIGFDLLTKSFRVILLDPPGWGFSPREQESPELSQLAKITAQAITAMGLAKYHLAAGSMGCTHALWLAVEQPQHIATISLEGSMSFRRDHWSMPGADPAALVAAAKQGADMTRIIPPAHPKKPWADLDFRTREFHRRLRVMALIGPEYDEALAARLRNLTIPVLAMFGAQDHFLLPSIATVYESIIPYCKTIIVPDAGHDLPGEQPELYAETVKNFIAQHTFAV